MICPYKDCPDRTVHCHSTCERYGSYSAQCESIRQKRAQEAAANMAGFTRGDKIRRDVRKHGYGKFGKS